jgi:hypothetical protein
MLTLRVSMPPDGDGEQRQRRRRCAMRKMVQALLDTLWSLRYYAVGAVLFGCFAWGCSSGFFTQMLWNAKY